MKSCHGSLHSSSVKCTKSCNSSVLDGLLLTSSLVELSVSLLLLMLSKHASLCPFQCCGHVFCQCPSFASVHYSRSERRIEKLHSGPERVVLASKFVT